MKVVLSICLLCVLLSKVYSEYNYYYVENYCEPMKEKKMTIVPTISGANSTGIIRPRRTSSYSAKMFCTMNIFPPVNYIVVISIEKIDFELESESKNLPEYLKICYPSCTTFSKRVHYPDGWYSVQSEHAVQLNYSTMGNDQTESLITGPIGFQITYTVASRYGNCDIPERFKCRNSICISSSQVCDGQNNCGDSSDEDCEVCGRCEKTEYLLNICTKNNDFQWKTFNVENYDKKSSVLTAVSEDDYTTPFDCLVNFKPTYTDGIILSVEKFQACSGSLKVYYDGKSIDLCADASQLKSPIHFIANYSMQLEYQTESKKKDFKPFNFSFVYTSASSDCREPGKFRCDNKRCISPYLVCDGHNNCGDLSDESCAVCGGCGYTKRYVEEFCNKDSPRQMLYNVKAHSAGILQPRKDGRYSRRLLCHLIISPPINYGIVLSVRKINFTRSTCAEGDYLTVFNGVTTEKLCKNFDYPYENLTFVSNDRMHMYYDTTAFNGSWVNFDSGFTVVYTVFSENTPCNDTLLFMCENKRCISAEYKCDSHNNCGDNSDEVDCPSTD